MVLLLKTEIHNLWSLIDSYTQMQYIHLHVHVQSIKKSLSTALEVHVLLQLHEYTLWCGRGRCAAWCGMAWAVAVGVYSSHVAIKIYTHA